MGPLIGHLIIYVQGLYEFSQGRFVWVSHNEGFYHLWYLFVHCIVNCKLWRLKGIGKKRIVVANKVGEDNREKIRIRMGFAHRRVGKLNGNGVPIVTAGVGGCSRNKGLFMYWDSDTRSRNISWFLKSFLTVTILANCWFKHPPIG